MCGLSSSGLAEVVPDAPERCVTSFEEYLSCLASVVLEEPGSTVAVISLFSSYLSTINVKLLKIVKGFASYLVITDDILNDVSEQSIVRLLSNGKRTNLCHNYQRLLLDAGWQVDLKWYCHGVRYASGIILASTN